MVSDINFMNDQLNDRNVDINKRLYYASALNKLHIVKRLISQGANVRKSNSIKGAIFWDASDELINYLKERDEIMNMLLVINHLNENN